MEQQGSSVSSAPIADISEMTADVLEHLHTMAPDSLVEVSQPTRRVIPPTSPSHPPPHPTHLPIPPTSPSHPPPHPTHLLE